MPGLPFIMIGRTDYMAWGITNNIVDNSDFYLETISNHTYLYDGKWLPLKETNETIKVYSFHNIYSNNCIYIRYARKKIITLFYKKLIMDL